MNYTRFERDRLGRLILRQAKYRVVERPYVLERGLALRDAAMVSLASGLWFFAVFIIAASSMGCASADGYDSPPESSSPGAQPDSSGRAWCCDAKDAEGKASLVCGMRSVVSYDTCYCHGIVRGHECLDETAWTPGTFCTQAQVVCWEE